MRHLATPHVGPVRRHASTWLPRLTTGSFALLLALAAPLAGQNAKISFRHLTQAEGLPSNNVSDILIGQRGFVWFGTYGGLCRYDGYRLVTVPLSPASSVGASDAAITALVDDGDGGIWIGTSDRGLVHYDPRTTRVRRFLEAPGYRDVVGHASIRALHRERNGTLWIGTYEGLFTMNTSKNSFRKVALPTGGAGGSVAGIVESDSLVWIATSGQGLFSIDPSTLEMHRFTHSTKDPSSLPDDQLTGIARDSHGVLWLGMRSRVAAYNAGHGTFRSVTLPAVQSQSIFADNSVNAIAEDANGSLWVGTSGGGLHRLDPSGDVEATYLHGTDPESISNNEISSLLVDSEGMIWAGTSGGGVNGFFVKPLTFIPRRLPRDPATGADPRVSCFAEDPDGSMWIGTATGTLRVFDPQERTLANATLSAPVSEMLHRYSLTSLSFAPDGMLWLGTGTGLVIYDPATGQQLPPANAAAETRALATAYVTSVLHTRNHEIVVCTSGAGLFLFRDDGRLISALRNDPSDSSSIPSSVVTCLYQARNGDLWVGTQDAGIFVLRGASHTVVRPRVRPADAEKITHTWVNAVAEDAGGNIWFGTISGLYRYDPRTRSVDQFDKARGLADDVVRSLVMDRRGTLWACTANGVSCIVHAAASGAVAQPGTDTTTADSLRYVIRNFRADDGLQGAEFLNGAAALGGDGTVYLGGVAGFNAFRPRDVAERAAPPPVVFTEFLINNKPIHAGDSTGYLRLPVIYTSKIVVPYSEKVLSFEFAALSFVRPDKNRYAYRLEGFDREWTYVDATRRIVTYTNLDYGEYTLYINASNSEGIWNDVGAAIHITILPPWYLTTWAFISDGLLIVGAVLLFSRIQRQRVIRKERAAAQIREAEFRANAAEQQAKLVEAQADAAEAKAMALQAENERQELLLEKARELETAYRELDESHRHLQSTQQQLIHAEKMASLGQLTAGIAHEIKNPLNFVTNFSGLSSELVEELQGSFTEDGAVKEGASEDVSAIISDLRTNLVKIREHGLRADGIVRSMLLHSSGKTGEKQPTDLNALIDEAANLAYHSLRSLNIAFSFEMRREYDPEVGRIELVPQEVSRVFLNLVQNGVYAMRKRAESTADGYAAELLLRTQRRGPIVEVLIRDNGTGIPESIRSKIFEPFFTTKPTGEGTGLGLSLSYDIIVKGHNGTMRVESEEGLGTTFIVTLPG